jgi:peroxiredoxin
MAKGNRNIGTQVTNLTMTDVDGKEHQLSEWCGKGNYVLIDFWASWCGPCLRELPNVISCYEKYHDKGFEIIGISFDNRKEAWLAAIKRLNMMWPQLSDLKGWKSLGAVAFGVTSIPANILVDPQGRIVALDLRGTNLINKLAEIYQ